MNKTKGKKRMAGEFWAAKIASRCTTGLGFLSKR